MLHNKYSEVPTNGRSEQNEKVPRKYFFRQLLVASGIWTPFFAIGIAVGTPTVYIPQVRRAANSTDAVSPEMASWLTSVFSYSALPSILVLAFLTEYIGRKKTFIIVSLNQVLVATCFYLSATPVHLLITEVFQGITNAGSITVCIVAIVEYTSPRNRGPLITIKSASLYWAIWAANTIGTFAPWKYISILGFVNAFYSLTVFFWPESPWWLASKGRYEECRRAHRWLRGTDQKSEQELEALIETHVEKRKTMERKTLKSTLKCFIDKEFYYPITLCSLLSLIYLLSGKQVVSLYAIDVLKRMMPAEYMAYYGMLILDGVSVFCMYIGCLLCRVLKRRVMLFSFGGTAIAFLFAISLYMYLVHMSYFALNGFVSLFFLVGFSAAIGSGPIILATSIHGELIPLKYKGEATIVISCIFMIFQSVLLKNTLKLMDYLNMHGMFLLYGVSASVCLSVLYKYLPETKDKTLQEIEKYFKN